MYKVIKNYCEDGNTNGLFLMDMPTGFGKTYSVLKYIFDACQKEENKDRKYFFITPLKKNLPIADFKEFFEKAGMLATYKEKFLFIDSTSESVLEGFSRDLEKTIPFEITKTQEYKELRQDIEFIQRQRKSNDYQLRQMAPGIEQDFRERTEKIFRRKISSILSKRFSSVKERLTAIKTDPNWQWVGKLYPAVFTQDMQIYFMSMDKFLARNTTIVEPSYQFYNNKIMDNAIIFIDEFDSTKETMIKNIIQNGLRDRIDFIELFRSIYSAMETYDFPTDLTTPSEQRKNSEYKSQSLTGVLSNTREKAREIHQLYALQFNHRTSDSTEDSSRNFLFQDHQFHSILNGNSKYITSVSDKKQRINTIQFTSEKPAQEKQNIQSMLGALRGFIQWFQGAVNILAINYRQLKNERRKDGEDEFTQEQAIRSVLSIFHISPYEIDYLTSQILISSRKSKSDQIAGSEFDRSVYEHGFRYYCFENDAIHDMQSTIQMCSFQNTPEKLLIRFCERAKVIGISATATVPTVIGNFDLEYLRNKMQTAFYKMPAEEYKRLYQEFQNSQSGYRKIQIHTGLIGAGEYSLQTWIDVVNDKELAEDIFERIEREVSDPYNKERYVRIAKAYKEFLRHDDIKSMLCLLTKFPAKGDRVLNSELLLYIMNIVEGVPNRDNPHIEYLKGDEYNTKKGTILDRLSLGRKLFVISTYQTIGAGQNLQYSIPPALRGKLICSNNFPPRNEKDFDAIYLDKPTNLFVNMEDNWSEENFVKYIFHVEFLQENAELSQRDAVSHIKKAFRCYSSGNKQNDRVENVYEKQSVRMFATRAVVQAVGRICRTNQKNPNIYIYADDRIADHLDLSVTNGRILNHEFMALVEKIKGTQQKAPISGSLEDKADLVSDRAGRDIDYMLNDDWTEGKIRKWQELRELVLRYPTASEEDARHNFIFPNYYVKVGRKSNMLYYSQDNDFRRINVSFSPTAMTNCIEDESGTRLDRLMCWDALREYFVSCGYAVSFQPNDYIMSPPIWNNIYKGALGEVTGKYWFKQALGIELEDLTDPAEFELFDFKIPNTYVYVDFKNWDETSDMDWDETTDKIQRKAEKCGCQCVIIANVLAKGDHKVQNFTKGNLEFLIVPSLLRDADTIVIDSNAVKEIRRCLNDRTD